MERGKTAWTAWQSLPEFTVPLQLLSRADSSEQIIKAHIAILKQFVLLLYCVCEDGFSTVNAARRHLFLERGKDFLQIPYGSDALHQHLLRVAYQSGHVWGNMLAQTTETVPVTAWGWESESPALGFRKPLRY